MGDSLWSKRLKTVIHSNWDLLKTGLSMNELSAQLIQNGLMSAEYWLDLKGSPKTMNDKVESYLGIVLKLSESKFNIFLDVLDKCDFQHIAATVRESLENKKEKTRVTQTCNTGNVQSQYNDRHTSKLQTRIKELEDCVTNLQKANEVAEKRIQDEVKNVQETNNRLLQKETELENFQEKIKLEENKKQESEIELKKARTEIEEMRQKEQELQQEKISREELEGKLQKTKHDLQQLESSRKELEEKLVKYEQDLQQKETSLTNLDENVRIQNQALNQKEALQIELELRLQRAESNLQEKMDEWVETCQIKDRELQITIEELEREKSKVSGLQSKVTELSESYDAQVNEVKKMKEKLEAHETEQEEKTADIANVRLGLEKITTLSEQFQNEKVSIKIENTKLSEELRGIKEKLNEKNDLLEQEKESRVSMGTRMEETINALRDENVDLRLRLTKFENNPTILQSRCSEDDPLDKEIKELDETIAMMITKRNLLCKRRNSKPSIQRHSFMCSIM